jgi:hypothetical protein
MVILSSLNKLNNSITYSLAPNPVQSDRMSAVVISIANIGLVHFENNYMGLVSFSAISNLSLRQLNRHPLGVYHMLPEGIVYGSETYTATRR